MFHKVEVYYDGYCSFCHSVKANFQKLDWLKKLSFIDFRNNEVNGIDIDELNKRMHVKDLSTGKITIGIYGIKTILQRVPLLMPLLPFLYLLNALGLGQICYDFVAERRLIVPVGHCTESGCKLPVNSADK
ncbi:DCC1-like thiol-disulfide oxidoreductase family protein [Ornithinibacillus scapharcae]|uniref:DCC1-like thiol-disulfide oxidoreductase family protein n=1 Tax=Ornithinibacillus scapharcae TaxID=1147159 RepID=UPI000225B064|nr:DCC1-like thiol-disulfide oxidoreductase family protein [Ornithinibacillus scapharcae]